MTSATIPAPISRICILGCGTMGRAVLSGLLESGLIESTAIHVSTCVSSDESANTLRATYSKYIDLGLVSVHVNDNVNQVRLAQAVILGTKPHAAQNILADNGMPDALQVGTQCLISLLAGVRIAQLEAWVPSSVSVVRAMPNTPCRIRQGMAILSCRSTLDATLKAFIKTMFSTLGRCRYIDEKHMDPVTALSGSGPAFACVMLEALADGAVMMGLPRDVAIELAAQALQGAARLVLESGDHPAVVKDLVTTPGGCTIAGLLTMEDGKIRSTLARTIQEATLVASKLGKQQNK